MPLAILLKRPLLYNKSAGRDCRPAQFLLAVLKFFHNRGYALEMLKNKKTSSALSADTRSAVAISTTCSRSLRKVIIIQFDEAIQKRVIIETIWKRNRFPF